MIRDYEVSGDEGNELEVVGDDSRYSVPESSHVAPVGSIVGSADSGTGISSDGAEELINDHMAISANVEDSVLVENSGKPKVVVVKNFPMRNRVAAIFSLPFLLLVSAFLAFPIVIFSRGQFDISTALVMTIAAEILVVVFALVYVGELGNWVKKLRLNNFEWKNVFGGFGLGLLLFMLLQACAIGLEALGMPIESSDTSTAITSSTGWTYIVIGFILVPIVVPFIEEVFFRGYVLGFFQDSFSDENKRKGTIWAIVVSSIIFSLAHFQGLSNSTDIFLLIWIGFIAVINGILFVKTKSIYTSFALHLAYNGITIALSAII